MLTALAIAVTYILPLFAVILPGLALVSPASPTSAYWTRVIIWSLVATTLTTLLLTVLNLPVELTALMWAAAGVWCGLRRRQLRGLLGPLLLFLAAYAGAAVFLVSQYEGLPTGDIQKSIIWAQDIIDHNRLPAYHTARERLNRDPVDFYTPALHTLTAAVNSLSPAPLTTAALTAIVLTLAAVSVGLGTTQLLFPTLGPKLLLVLTAFFMLTQVRFLRYLREPGYHYQNIIGELLLFASLYLIVALVKKWQWQDALLLALTLGTLALSHQFSFFLAVFALAVPLLILVGKSIMTHAHRSAILALTLAALALAASSGVILGLHHKIDDIFTSTPHLASLNPALADYPRLMGNIWMIAAVLGFVWVAARALKQRSPRLIAFTAATAVLMLLTQAPRIFIDIPPVRTLLYLALPLSICAAAWITAAWQWLRLNTPPAPRLVIASTSFLIIATSGLTAAAHTMTPTTAVRTNSSMSQDHAALAAHISAAEPPGTVLVDDYNHRAASWLVISGRPTVTRIASDLERQMNEAKQSALRSQLYLNQLDYEKIFSLASQPFSTELIKKHNIQWVTGITNTSAAGFQSNPALEAATSRGLITLFRPAPTPSTLCPAAYTSNEQSWLLRASTLVNDIGDNEDTFAHLPASIRTTRLSEPEVAPCHTVRTTTAPAIPLIFNPGDYTAALWQTDTNPQATYELLLRFDAPAALELITPTGQTLTINPNAGPVRLPAEHAPIDERGIITFILNNPAELAITIDLIALGPARVP